MRLAYRRRRDLLHRQIGAGVQLAVETARSRYVLMVDVSRTGKSARDFASGLLEAERWLLLPAPPFGRTRELRAPSISAPRCELEEAVGHRALYRRVLRQECISLRHPRETREIEFTRSMYTYAGAGPRNSMSR